MANRPESEAIIRLLQYFLFAAIARGDAIDLQYLTGAMADLARRVADLVKVSIAEPKKPVRDA